DHAVLDHPGGGPAGVPEQGVEVGDVDQGDVVPVGERVPGPGHVPGRGVVLHVDTGHGAPQPPAGELDLMRALVDGDVDLLAGEPVVRHLAHRLRPGVGHGPAAAVRAPVRGD